MVLRYEDSKFLESAPLSSLKTIGSMEQYFLIDSNGHKYDMGTPVTCEPIKGLSVLFAQMTGKKLQITWPSIDKSEISLSHTKELIRADWSLYSETSQAYDLETMSAQLDAAETFSEVMKVFGH